MQLAEDLRMKNEQHVRWGGGSVAMEQEGRVNRREGTGLAGAPSRVWLFLQGPTLCRDSSFNLLSSPARQVLLFSLLFRRGN